MSCHFRDEDITVVQSVVHRDCWEITFRGGEGCHTGGGSVAITMQIPKKGVIDGSKLDAEVDQALARRLARMVASILRNTLTAPRSGEAV